MDSQQISKGFKKNRTTFSTYAENIILKNFYRGIEINIQGSQIDGIEQLIIMIEFKFI